MVKYIDFDIFKFSDAEGELEFPVIPSFLVDHDEDLMFYNGLALIGQSEFDVEIARKIMESKVFWYYIDLRVNPIRINITF